MTKNHFQKNAKNQSRIQILKTIGLRPLRLFLERCYPLQLMEQEIVENLARLSTINVLFGGGAKKRSLRTLAK